MKSNVHIHLSTSDQTLLLGSSKSKHVEGCIIGLCWGKLLLKVLHYLLVFCFNIKNIYFWQV